MTILLVYIRGHIKLLLTLISRLSKTKIIHITMAIKLLSKKRPAVLMSEYFMIFLTLLSGLSFFYGIDSKAQGNLLITPRRVVFEGSKRSVDLNLANTGIDTATYAISLIQIRMTTEGGFETITEPDPDQLFADKYIRFFPRSVTLGPNEGQIVKVQVSRFNELSPGEYGRIFISEPFQKQNLLERKKLQEIQHQSLSS